MGFGIACADMRKLRVTGMDAGEQHTRCQHGRSLWNAGHDLLDERGEDRKISKEYIKREGHIGRMLLKSGSDLRRKVCFQDFTAADFRNELAESGNGCSFGGI